MARKNEYIQEIDKFIGGKVYSLRLGRGLARQQLADLIGVTHQQLQKYEKGTNRISAGRLVLIAKALREDINYFYAGLDSGHKEKILTQHQRMCIEVSRNFMKIKNAEYQDSVNNLIRILAKNPD